ncbi:hypothetical protein WG66_000946 [Moniliophthora roreri]|nr:hypothetical protein WG66_000946 [Moniliophthora roreri]
MELNGNWDVNFGRQSMMVNIKYDPPSKELRARQPTLTDRPDFCKYKGPEERENYLLMVITHTFVLTAPGLLALATASPIPGAVNVDSANTD